MDSDHLRGGSARTEGLHNDERSTVPKLVYNFGRPSRRWKDTYNNVGSEVSSRVTRVSHRTYFDEDGFPCGLVVICETNNNPTAEPGSGISFNGNFGG